MSGFLIIFVVSALAAVCGQQKTLRPGDACRLENSKKGTCRPFPQCPSAIQDVAQFDKWPLLCRYDDDTSIVCCDDTRSESSTTATATTPSTTTTTTSTPRSTTTTVRTSSSTTTRRSKPNRISGILSRQKCQLYSKWQPIPTLTFEDEEQKIAGKCGAYTETFIYDGEQAERLEFPHMAHLGFTDGSDDDEEPEWSCGGSLISENFVITAAHCLKKKDGTFVTHVRLGAGDVKSKIIVKVDKPFSHPDYKRNSVYNDIALLKLQKNVKFTDYRRPACLQANKHFPGIHAVASGWGATENNSGGSKHLLKVKLPLMNHTECSKTYVANPLSLPRGIDDQTMVCAGGLNLKKDTCQGDSGGPLQIVLQQPYCMYSIVGLTSFGIKCGIAPGVYTRVSAFIPWIESIVWPNL